MNEASPSPKSVKVDVPAVAISLSFTKNFVPSVKSFNIKIAKLSGDPLVL